MSSPEFYQHSGRSGGLGVPLAMGAGLVVAALLAVGYSYAVNWIPFVYVNFFVTLGVGFGVGIAVGYGAKLGKMRNNLIRGGVGLVCGCVALYVAWAFDPFVRSNHKLPIIWEPTYILEWMKLGYENGFWAIGRGGGGNVTGVFLALVWVVEAGVIVGLAGLTAFGFSSDEPFCEDCNAWTKAEPAVATMLPAEDDETSLPSLLEGNLDALGQLVRVAPSSYPRLEVDLYTCPSCDDSNYMTVRLCTETVDKKGEKSTSDQSLLKNLYVAATDVEKVRNAGREQPSEEVNPS